MLGFKRFGASVPGDAMLCAYGFTCDGDILFRDAQSEPVENVPAPELVTVALKLTTKERKSVV